jgi:hypothetical protein
MVNRTAERRASCNRKSLLICKLQQALTAKVLNAMALDSVLEWHMACVTSIGTIPNDPNDKFGRT